jgi:pimeloyl-ACP methyl ester carboxylesterase
MRLWEYVAAGHLPWLDDPAAVASATATFLATGTQQVLAA